MVTSDSNRSGNPPLPSAIQRYVRSIQYPWPGSGGVLYTLRADCTQEQRRTALAAVRELHHPIAVSMVGDEILAFGRQP